MAKREQDLQALVREIVDASGISQAQLARDAGLSYAALHAWITGIRSPRPGSLVQLAEGLESRSDALRELAMQLKQAAGNSKQV
ncbi:helix-turn-helix transcriptional regulator [Longimicrobium sp.]|uniref:helix-turn-helix domain-containing protein n=1 Tax=Longimicrobium sp. TaxID=2029185 RepID=UPI002E33CAC4|nr:helix-turn-helix transcriptional regulator [Longimicrobium sp.]HEX6041064.1 helix-turn-helix transcriptional regulator [Longimicrobium sp.]